jgi:threonine/homoserine/homoserine lactone efflux protein
LEAGVHDRGLVPRWDYAMNWGLYAVSGRVAADLIARAVTGYTFLASRPPQSSAQRWDQVTGHRTGFALGFAHLLQTAPGLPCQVVMRLLVALGVQALRAVPADEAASSAVLPLCKFGLAGPLLQGFLVETTNPKSILFFSALIPQFVDPQLGHVQAQLLFLGCTFLCLQVTWDASLMLVVHHFRHRLGKAWTPTRQRWAHRVSGATFVGLGLALLLHERPQA